MASSCFGNLSISILNISFQLKSSKFFSQLIGEFLSEMDKPGELIVTSAKKKRVTYIVMASRGFTRSRKTIIGTVSDFVIHNADCPVVMARTWLLESEGVENKVVTSDSLTHNGGHGCQYDGDGCDDMSDEKDDDDNDDNDDDVDDGDDDEGTDVIKMSVRRGSGDGMEAVPEKCFKASGHGSGSDDDDDVNSLVAKTALSRVDATVTEHCNFDLERDQHGMLIPVHKMKMNLGKDSQAYFHTNKFANQLSACDSRLIWTDVSKSSTIAMRGHTTVHLEQTVAMDMQIDGDCKRRVVKHTLETVVMPEYLEHFQETFRDSDFIFFIRLLPLLFLCWFFLLTSGIASVDFNKFVVALIVIFLFSVRSSISDLVGKVTSAQDDSVQLDPSLDYPD